MHQNGLRHRKFIKTQKTNNNSNIQQQPQLMVQQQLIPTQMPNNMQQMMYNNMMHPNMIINVPIPHQQPNNMFQQQPIFQQPQNMFQQQPIFQQPQNMFQQPQNIFQQPQNMFQQQPIFQQPQNMFQQTQNIFQQPHNMFQQQPIFQQPQNMFQQPQNIFQQPQNIFQQPQNMFQQPQNIFQQPQNMFQQPQNMFQPQPIKQETIINNVNINPDELMKINEENIDNIDNNSVEENENNLVIEGLENRLNNSNKILKKVYVENNDVILANMLDNTLDNVINVCNSNDEKKEKYIEFGQNDNNSNVISKITPKHKLNANFDKDKYPNEIYNVSMLNGNVNELSANDIHSYSLETHKYIYEYNNSIMSNKFIEPTGFIYARCSTSNDISIETQRNACFNYAKKNNIKLLDFGYQYDNNVSARNMNNLEYELGFWENRIPDNSNLIIYSVDRLSRNLLKGVQFLEKLANRGINIHFVSNEIIYNINISAAAKSMIHQELQTAEKYSNMTSEKIKSTLKRLRDEGHIFGNAPYGYKHIKINGIRKRVINIIEQNNIKSIIKRYKNCVKNFEQYQENIGKKKNKKNIILSLLRWCNRTGLKYRNNNNYTVSQINKIINSNVVEYDETNGNESDDNINDFN
jgi:DNA invertase Pin-like site-specific DNA recombinase